MAVAKQLVVPNDQYEQAVQGFNKLRDAVRVLYYAAHWIPDRPLHRTEFFHNESTNLRDSKEVQIDAGELWTAVRDAAGFPKGNAPTPLPFDGIHVEYDANRLRLLGKLVRKSKGDPEFTSEQARAFLLLHSQELQDRLDKTVRDFLKEKL